MKRPADLVEPLKKRELEILSLLAASHTNNEIAASLNLSLNSVKWYAQQIYTKLGVSNRRNAVLKAQELGLLVTDEQRAKEGKSYAMPSGTVTFLFTDVVGNVPLWECDSKIMEVALARHHAILDDAAQSHHGLVFKILGDEFQIAFDYPENALEAALQAQRLLRDERWGATGPLMVRMGLHTGPAEIIQGVLDTSDYAVSHTINRVARIRSAAHGGQILLSAATRELLHNYRPQYIQMRDLGEVYLKGMSLAEHLFQVVVADLPQVFPALETAITYSNNLPLQMTSFIGRGKEIVEVSHLLADHRLVTLTGAGGTGKTRLALQVATEVLAHYPNGAWLVELAPISNPAQLIQAVAAVLGLQASIDLPIHTILTNYLKNRSLLLVLDNCEHLLEACAKLTESLLHACPKLTILATSREALRVSGEVAYRVPSLSVPDPDQLPSVNQLANFEAAHLFSDRAVATHRHFQVSSHNARNIALICQRVDGIPLAIELAAARVSVMSVEQICTRLDHSFQLLTGGSRTSLPRHKTLHASIDWSYNLLSETERLLLKRLSIFTGGWTLEAAEKVCGFDGIDEAEVLDILTSLVNKSLVNLVEEEKREPDSSLPEVETRYRMLETIRQYAFEQLTASAGMVPDPLQMMKQRHLHYYCGLAERTESGFCGPKQAFWIESFKNEWGNYRSALDWSISLSPTGHLEEGLRILYCLNSCTFYLGYAKEALTWIDSGLEQLNRQPDPPALLLARTYYSGSGAHWCLSNYAKSVDYCEKAIHLLRQVQFLNDLGEALGWYALALHFNGSGPGRALDAAMESMAIASQIDDQSTLASSLYMVGIIKQQTDPQAAINSLKESLSLREKTGDLVSSTSVLRGLGALAMEEGDFKQARSYLLRALDIDQKYGLKFSKNWELSALGDLAYLEGQYTQMELYFRECLATSEQIGFREPMVWSLHHLGVAARRQGHLEASLEFYRRSILLAQEYGFVQHSLENLAGLAGLALERGQASTAVKLLGLVAKQGMEGFGPITLEEFDRDRRAARDMLSDSEFQQAWEAGAQMTIEQGLEYLGELTA